MLKMNEINKILIEIQDHLVPILDTYEQAIYHNIFRHTFLIGEKDTLFSLKSASIGLGAGQAGSTPSESQRSKKLRSLVEKGAVKIIERSHKGILVEIVLPNEIPNLISNLETSEINIEHVDFYINRKLLPVILAREESRCFYTGKKITVEKCYLDHVIPQSNGGNNSYKNIVATSYDANSMKNNKSVEDFTRELYQEDLISLDEFKKLKEKIIKLKSGQLIPNAREVELILNKS